MEQNSPYNKFAEVFPKSGLRVTSENYETLLQNLTYAPNGHIAAGYVINFIHKWMEKQDEFTTSNRSIRPD